MIFSKSQLSSFYDMVFNFWVLERALNSAEISKEADQSFEILPSTNTSVFYNDDKDFIDELEINKICFICFENNIEYCLDCGHSFCSECITKWFEHTEQNNIKNHCPVCRNILLHNSKKISSESFVVIGSKKIEKAALRASKEISSFVRRKVRTKEGFILV